MALIATKQKANVEKAINSFMEMVSDEVSALSLCYGIILYNDYADTVMIHYEYDKVFYGPNAPHNCRSEW